MREKHPGAILLIVQDSIKKNSGRHGLPAKKTSPIQHLRKITLGIPRNCLPAAFHQGASSGVYAFISMSGILFKARILTYITLNTILNM